MPDGDARGEFDGRREGARRGPGEDLDLTAAASQLFGDLGDVDVHAARVAGARLLQGRGVDAEHRDPTDLIRRHSSPILSPCVVVQVVAVVVQVVAVVVQVVAVMACVWGQHRHPCRDSREGPTGERGTSSAPWQHQFGTMAATRHTLPPVSRAKPEGRITRGTTNPNRLRRADRWLAGTQELVEDQCLTTRAQYSRDFAEAPGGIGNDCQDQVQDRDIETAGGKRQILRVSLDRREIDMAGTRDGAVQHGMGEVQTDVMMVGGQVRQVETGADSRQQDPARRRREHGQAVLARGQSGARDCCIVERRNQRVAEFQAQCRTRGIASTNSGISASKRVPSSPTIW